MDFCVRRYPTAAQATYRIYLGYKFIYPPGLVGQLPRNARLVVANVTLTVVYIALQLVTSVFFCESDDFHIAAITG